MLIGVIAAAAAATAPVVLVRPVWLQRPTAADVAATFPNYAAGAGISGVAEVVCTVLANGRMSQCRVFGEAPAGGGFGAAALKMTPKFRVAPLDPAAGPSPIVYIPMRYTMVDGRPPTRIILNDPVWASGPDAAAFAAAFPASASAPAGDVTLRCGVEADGALSACETLKESPQQQGFAEAARGLAVRCRVDLGGRPPRGGYGLAVDIRIHLDAPAPTAGRP